MFAGENGVGKTTLLDAIRIYASRSHYRVLEKILKDREEITAVVDEDGNEIFLDWRALFHGRYLQKGTVISIGPKAKHQKLHIKIVPMEEKDIEKWGGPHRDIFGGDDLKIQTEFKGEKRSIPMYMRAPRYSPPYYRKLDSYDNVSELQ